MAMPNHGRDEFAKWTTTARPNGAPRAVDAVPARLTVRLLGEIEVIRDDEPVVLPSSRKARALLAYLVATGRSHRRSRLCSLLWDIPDDPRGALRSALSKLRAVVDGEGCPRIVADRDSVRFDPTGVEVDLAVGRSLLASGGDRASTAALEAAAASFRGVFAEDLALTNCPDFHAWCVAEREEARRLHAGLLRTLLKRHEADPEAALPHARTLARVAPHGAAAHVALLQVLMGCGRQHEAREQHDLSLRALAEIGESAVNELSLAWRALARKPASGEHDAGSGETPEDAPSATPPSRKPAILVLPFTNVSGNPEQDYFSYGITEDIITDLSQISAISVVACSTTCTLEDKALGIGHLAAKLKVGYVLDGSVRRAGNRLRITAQLLDVATGSPLWAERFDRVFRDIFALQDEISQSVVAALRVKLLPEEMKAITARPTVNAQAYRYYLEGRAKLAVSWSNKEYLRTVRGLFAKAARLDPGYARAYAGMADCDAFAWVSGDLDVSYEDMLANSSKAMELAPYLAEAHASKGMALYASGHPDAAIPLLRRAMELDPQLFEAHFFHGLSCRDTGDFVHAALSYERAAALQVRNHQPVAMLADVLIAMGRREQGEAAARRCIERIEDAFGRNPEVAEVLGMGATVLVNLGDHERADRWVGRAMLLDPESYSVRYNAACTYAVIGRLDDALKCLEHAYAHMPRARCWLLANAKHDAQLNSLRDRADFQDLMQRLEAHAAAF